METTKIRDRVLKYCEGVGIDIGCGQDKIRPEAIGIDKVPHPGVNIVAEVLCCMDLLWFHNECLDYVYTAGGTIEYARTMDSIDPSMARENHGDRVIGDALLWRAMGECAIPTLEPSRRIPPNSIMGRRLARKRRERDKDLW